MPWAVWRVPALRGRPMLALQDSISVPGRAMVLTPHFGLVLVMAMARGAAVPGMAPCPVSCVWAPAALPGRPCRHSTPEMMAQVTG